ncbi:hypothetical protein ACE6ED_15740 [Paenibacillus sp. CN-4]|uniref:hypothetical protein n=1 Tax=Paenibacillus nanchangensis TaxID=3348343 RepID=UPI003978AE6D
MKTTIEFMTHPVTGKIPMSEFLDQLVKEAKTDAIKLQLLLFITRGFEFLEKYSLQHAFKTYFETHREDGVPYTIKLVKNLERHVPLIEFRINWRGIGAFRAIFFEHVVGDNQILFFINCVVKPETKDPAFERAAKDAEMVYQHFLTHPEEHITLIGDGKHD